MKGEKALYQAPSLRGKEKADGEQLTEEPFVKNLRAAVDALRTYNGACARVFLQRAVFMDMEKPETFNLLGISYEQEGDVLKAAKFYRVAYYLDQTFAAPSENLHRICNIGDRGYSDIKWGLERIGGENR